LYNASREVWRLPGPEDPLKDFDKKCVNLRAAREGFQDGFLGSQMSRASGELVTHMVKHNCSHFWLKPVFTSSIDLAILHQTTQIAP
jgi:hypothetical protein